MNETKSGLVVGIVGLGERGRNIANRVCQLGHEVVGADADQSEREKFEQQFDVKSYHDPGELYGERPDAAVITAPPRFHEPAAISALESGIPLYIEKPLAHTLGSAEDIAEATADSNVTCMVGFYFRFFDHVQVLKSYIDEGRFGEISYIEAREVFRRNVPIMGSWYTSKALAGGGALIDRGSYCIDIVLHLLDYPSVNRVVGETWTNIANRDDYAHLNTWGEESEEKMLDVEDSAIAFIEFDDGTVVSLNVAWAANARNTTHTYSLYGDEAGAKMTLFPEDDPSLCLFETRQGGRDHHLNTEVVVENRNPQIASLSHFFEAVRRGEQPEQGCIEQAMEVQRVIERIYQSVQ